MSKVECFGDVSSTVKSQSFMFRSSARTHTHIHLHTHYQTHQHPPPPFSCCTSGIPKGAGTINPCTLPPRTRKHAGVLGRTPRTHAHRWHRVIRSARVRERLTRCLGKFSLDDVYGHHIHQSDLHPITSRRERCWSICCTLSIRFTPDQTDSVSLLVLLLLLFLALVGYFGSAHSRKHALESLRQRRRVLKCYHIYPQRIDAFKWAIGLLRMCHWSGAWQRREVEEKPPEVVSSVTAASKSAHVSGTCCRRHLKGVRSAVPGAQLGNYNVPSAGPPPAAFGAKREMVITTRSASKNRYLVRIFPKHSKDCFVRSGWATATGHHRNKHFRLYGKELRV